MVTLPLGPKLLVSFVFRFQFLFHSDTLLVTSTLMCHFAYSLASLSSGGARAEADIMEGTSMESGSKFALCVLALASHVSLYSQV